MASDSTLRIYQENGTWETEPDPRTDVEWVDYDEWMTGCGYEFHAFWKTSESDQREEDAGINVWGPRSLGRSTPKIPYIVEFQIGVDSSVEECGAVSKIALLRLLSEWLPIIETAGRIKARRSRGSE